VAHCHGPIAWTTLVPLWCWGSLGCLRSRIPQIRPSTRSIAAGLLRQCLYRSLLGAAGRSAGVIDQRTPSHDLPRATSPTAGPRPATFTAGARAAWPPAGSGTDAPDTGRAGPAWPLDRPNPRRRGIFDLVDPDSLQPGRCCLGNGASLRESRSGSGGTIQFFASSTDVNFTQPSKERHVPKN
jgi:hypothetical protein